MEAKAEEEIKSYQNDSKSYMADILYFLDEKNRDLKNFKKNLNYVSKTILSDNFYKENNEKAKVLSCIFGAFLGDSYGSFCEFKKSSLDSKENSKKVFVESNVFNEPKGHVTDDSEMAMSMAYAIMDMRNIKKIDPNLNFFYYGLWLKTRPKDIGNTTFRGLYHFKKYSRGEYDIADKDLFKYRSREDINKNSLSNGFLMRISTFVVWYYYSHKKEVMEGILEGKGTLELVKDIAEQVYLDNKSTHSSKEVKYASALFVFMALCAICGVEPKEIIKKLEVVINDFEADLARLKEEEEKKYKPFEEALSISFKEDREINEKNKKLKEILKAHEDDLTKFKEEEKKKFDEINKILEDLDAEYEKNKKKQTENLNKILKDIESKEGQNKKTEKLNKILKELEEESGKDEKERHKKLDEISTYFEKEYKEKKKKIEERTKRFKSLEEEYKKEEKKSKEKIKKPLKNIERHLEIFKGVKEKINKNIKLFDDTEKKMSSLDEKNKKKEFFELKKELFSGMSGHHMGYYLHAFSLTLFYLYFCDEYKDKSNNGAYKKIMLEICDIGGDTDTNAAIVGTVIGPIIGLENFPKDDLEVLIEFCDDKRFIYSSGLMYYYIEYLESSYHQSRDQSATPGQHQPQDQSAAPSQSQPQEQSQNQSQSQPQEQSQSQSQSRPQEQSQNQSQSQPQDQSAAPSQSRPQDQSQNQGQLQSQGEDQSGSQTQEESEKIRFNFYKMLKLLLEEERSSIFKGPQSS